MNIYGLTWAKLMWAIVITFRPSASSVVVVVVVVRRRLSSVVNFLIFDISSRTDDPIALKLGDGNKDDQ